MFYVAVQDGKVFMISYPELHEFRKLCFVDDLYTGQYRPTRPTHCAHCRRNKSFLEPLLITRGYKSMQNRFITINIFISLM